MFRYDGTLVGCAIYTFLSVNNSTIEPPSLINKGVPILIVLSVVVGVLHSSCVNMNKLPALTLAFNIVMLAFLLSVARGDSTVATPTWLVNTDAPADTTSLYWARMTFAFFLDALFRGVGQFCFVGTTIGGFFVVLGILICSRQAGCMALIGSLTAMIVARYILVLPVGHRGAIRLGLFSYNAVGTCVALGGDIFFKSDVQNTLVAVFAAAVTVLMQTAIASILDTDDLGLPVLTCPFVLTAWIMMLMRSHWLKPILNAGDDLDEARMLDRRHDDAWWHRPKKSFFNESAARKAMRLKTVPLSEDVSSPMQQHQPEQQDNQV